MSAAPARWTFLETGDHPGAWNMAFDERVAGEVRNGRSGPVIRLFRWRPPAVSLGLHQNADELDAPRCSADGVEIVRRPTGGRAILHDEELTYSVVMPAREGVMEVYERIAHALLRGLHLFGVRAELAHLQPERLGAAGSPSSIPCFASTGRFEIAWRGRKLVGSAQRQYREEGIVLQHGSILTGPGHRRLVRYLRVDDRTRERLEAELARRTVDLSEITAGEVPLERLSACIRRGFEEAWNIALTPPRGGSGKEGSDATFADARG